MRRYYGAGTAFLDLLFNSLLGFVAMFFIAFILMNQKAPPKGAVESKAEFIITVDWPPERNDDVDTYLEDPLGNLIFFRQREAGLMHLDRDDLGHRSDKVATLTGEEITYANNREIVSIRGIVPGEYVMNVHMYAKNSHDPTEVTVQMVKVNPAVRTVALKKVLLVEDGAEKTVFRFTIGKDGEVESLNELPKRLAGPRLSYDNES